MKDFITKHGAEHGAETFIPEEELNPEPTVNVRVIQVI